MKPLYIIWFLLPLLLLMMTAWALLKPVFGVQGREYAGDYFKQAVFCLIGFFIAIGLDGLDFDYLIVGLIAVLGLGDNPEAATVVRWVLYPVVLLAMAYAHKTYLRMTGRDPHDRLKDGLARYKR